MCVIYETKAATFAIADAKLYVPVATLSTQDNAKTIATTEIRFQRNN